jgi:20S proteasome alpha/beta subunit
MLQGGFQPHCKPLGFSRQKLVRIPRRTSVTIVAGFKGCDGVVLCADSQETVANFKRKIPKLRVEPSSGGEDLAVAFCGSGHGPFLDMVVDKAWKDVKGAISLQDACDKIQESIKSVHEEYGKIYQPGSMPEIELLYGVKMSGDTKLFHAFGPVINEKDYYAAGVGQDMADYLSSRMYGNHLDVRQLIILAAFILFQTKDHIDGCGGDSHIAVLKNRGLSGRVDPAHVEKLTGLANTADTILARTLLSCVNIKLSGVEFRRNLKIVKDLIEDYRSDTAKEIKELKATEAYWFLGQPATDSLGIQKLPKTYKRSRKTKS